MYDNVKKNLDLLKETRIEKEKVIPERRNESLDIFNSAFKLTEEDIAANKDISNKEPLPKGTEDLKGKEKEEKEETKESHYDEIDGLRKKISNLDTALDKEKDEIKANDIQTEIDRLQDRIDRLLSY